MHAKPVVGDVIV